MHDAAHREAVSAALAAAAHGDPALFRASGVSPLGLVEISRRRIRPSLVQQLGERCPTCAGDRYVVSAQSACYEILRAARQRVAAVDDGGRELLLEAPRPVVERLRGDDAAHLAALCDAQDCRIGLCVRDDFAGREFRLAPVADADEPAGARRQAEPTRR